jgi:uncharacterized membrane protein
MSTSEADDLRELLLTLTPSAREHLRDVLIRDDADRDAISSRLMRYRDQNGQGWADIIDLLTMYRMFDEGSFGPSQSCRRMAARPTALRRRRLADTASMKRWILAHAVVVALFVAILMLGAVVAVGLPSTGRAILVPHGGRLLRSLLCQRRKGMFRGSWRWWRKRR